MESPEGIRMRISELLEMIPTEASSDIVIVFAIVDAAPTMKLWFAPDEIVTFGIKMNRPSVASAAPLSSMSSSRLSAAETAVKLSPETVIQSPPLKSAVTSRTRIRSVS